MENIISEQIFQPKNLFPERQKAFEEDFNILFLQIENNSSIILSFYDFKQLWKKTSLNSLTYAKDKREDPEEYYKLIYGILINNYLSPDHLNLNLACFYSLYIIFLSQSEFERVQINLNINVLKKINHFFKCDEMKKNFDFKWIIQKLVNLNAFSFEQRIGIKTLSLSKYGTAINNSAENRINEFEHRFNEDEEQNKKQEFQLENLKNKCENYFSSKKKLKESIKKLHSKGEINLENENILKKFDKSDSLLPNLIEFKFQKSLN